MFKKVRVGLFLALSLTACAAPDGESNADCLGAKCDNAGQTSALDGELRRRLDEAGVEALERENSFSSAMIELGQALYFDKELSGNRDIACATCHHPLTMSTDQLSLPIGVGGKGLGPDRIMGEGRELVPRNAPDVYNRGSSHWTTMFWDNRIRIERGELVSPAGDALPDLLETPLAAQAMFPPTSGAEMRGAPGDLDVFGEPNELAMIPEGDTEAIWAGIAKRLVAIDEYVELFKAAFPGLEEDEIGFEHAAVAIAAFEEEHFTFTNSDFDRYLRGDDSAMSQSAKQGAMLFYGKAGCASCHSGPLLSDQELHNICSPQVGPGRGDAAPEDAGGVAVTGNEKDRYAFRTPSLRNVSLTGPYMHAGSYVDLEAAIRHHLDVQKSMMSFDASSLEPMLRDTLQNSPEQLEAMLRTLDPLVASPTELSDEEVGQLMDFMDAVTDFDAGDLNHLVPISVPSGLPVHD